MPDQEPRKEKTITDLSKEERATIRTGEEAERFLASEFGKFLLHVQDAHIKKKEAELYNPHEPDSGLDGIGYALRAESSKGTIMGIRLTKHLIEGMVESAKQVKASRGIAKTAGSES